MLGHSQCIWNRATTGRCVSNPYRRRSLLRESFPEIICIFTSHLKKRILVQDRGGGKIETGGILKYSEDLNFTSSKDIGSKDFFEMACS
jgi:hypothetical protein